jgi:hypothetical protein
MRTALLFRKPIHPEESRLQTENRRPRISTIKLTGDRRDQRWVKLSKASLKHRIRNFILGMTALATGLTGLLIIFLTS